VGENWGTLFYGCSAPFHCSVSRRSPFSRGLGVKRDLRRIIESIVGATTSAQSSNQTARPKADALNVRPVKRLTCCAARVAACRNAVLNNKPRSTDSAAASSRAVSGDACEILVPTESRTKKRFGSRGCGKGCERHSPSGGYQ